MLREHTSKVNVQFETKSSENGIVFHDVNYAVPVRKRFCFSKRENKSILSNVSGIMKPGLNAILGTTGSGKTSLLDVLAGRKNPKFLTGTVIIDGQKQPKNFNSVSGYVVQDDILMGTLSVRENLYMSSNLRLEESISTEERRNRVEDTIKELCLSKCADSKIGTYFVRGISGGERKRCSIGMELIIKPKVLFLDEPTTGLDASTANSLLLLLRRLSKANRIVIFSIHQPRYNIFKLFDWMVIMHSGQVAFQGKQEDLLPYFENLGFHCEAYNNPADFILDVINGDIYANELDDEATSSSEVSQELNPEEATNNIFITNYLKSLAYERLKGEIQSHFDFYSNWSAFQTEETRFLTTFKTQFKILSKRTLINLLRNPETSILQVLLMFFVALLCGIIYFKLDLDLKTGVQNRTGAFFFIVMTMIFGNITTIELFIKDRVLFYHENMSGFYRVSAYFLSKILCDILPMRTFPVLLFSSITYWMINLQLDAEKFFIFTVNLLTTTLAASALCFCVSASVRLFSVANLIVSVAYIIMMIFSGILINVTTLSAIISWLKYFSLFRYSMNVLSINELKNLNFCISVPNNGTLSPSQINCEFAGNEYLDVQGIAHQSGWDLWQNVIAMMLFAIAFFILAYVQLRRIPKYK